MKLVTYFSTFPCNSILWTDPLRPNVLPVRPWRHSRTPFNRQHVVVHATVVWTHWTTKRFYEIESLFSLKLKMCKNLTCHAEWLMCHDGFLIDLFSIAISHTHTLSLSHINTLSHSHRHTLRHTQSQTLSLAYNHSLSNTQTHTLIHSLSFLLPCSFIFLSIARLWTHSLSHTHTHLHVSFRCVPNKIHDVGSPTFCLLWPIQKVHLAFSHT